MSRSMPVQKPYQSKQDVGTPREFLDAVEKKFGSIVFDLAAHAGNKVCDNYFAPEFLNIIYNPNKPKSVSELIAEAVCSGAVEAEAEKIISIQGKLHNWDLKIKFKIPNRDQNSQGLDSLKQNWSKLNGTLWLNPEYEKIGPWAEKSFGTGSININYSGDRSQKILMLIPSSTGTDYWFNYIHEKALVQFLSPRISFDGINPYPKDLSLIIYGLNPGYECWRWKD